MQRETTESHWKDRRDAQISRNIAAIANEHGWSGTEAPKILDEFIPVELAELRRLRVIAAAADNLFVKRAVEDAKRSALSSGMRALSTETLDACNRELRAYESFLAAIDEPPGPRAGT